MDLSYDRKELPMQSMITRPDSLSAINDAMRPYGRGVDIVLITPDSLINFSRKTGTEVQQSTGFALLRQQIRTTGIALPRAFAVEGDTAIHLCAGAGVTGDDTNPNAKGTGLALTVAQLDADVALATTLADAPAGIFVHTLTGLTAAVSGVDHLLGRGTIPQAIELMRQQSYAIGIPFFLEDLRLVTSPGARKGYAVNDRMIKVKLAGLDAAILSQVIILDYYPGADKPHSLDLALLFKLLCEVYVSSENIDFDERDTITDPNLPSKRRTGPDYGSGIMAVRSFKL